MGSLSLSPGVVDRLTRVDRRVVVTGASGWIGRASLEMLADVYGDAFTERVHCFGSTARTLELRGGRSTGQFALGDLRNLSRHRSVLLHFACLTKDKVSRMTVSDYVRTNREIAASVVEAAENIGVDRVFLVSSGAVYAALAEPREAQTKNPYGAVKLEEEECFGRFAQERSDRGVVTARLFNLSGPYINKLGSYALSSFIDQARDRKAAAAINIAADHPVIRSYVGVGNLLNIALAHLLDDDVLPYDWFDTAGEREVEVADLANVVRTIVNPNVSIKRPEAASVVVDRYVGDGKKFRSLASRYGIALHDLPRQVRDTAEYMGAISEPATGNLL